MELQDQVRVASMKKLPVEHTNSLFGVKQILATKVVKYLGCQLECQVPVGIQGKHARRGADEGYQSHQGPGSIFSKTVGSSFYWLEHKNQAVADAGSEHSAVCSRSSCVAYREA